MNNPFLEYVRGIQGGVASARDIPASRRKNSPVESKSKVLLFSPHPDDECITGLLPLRLMREAHKQIVNVPVTYGSNVERRAARAAELADACAYLGWENYRPADTGLEPLGVAALVETLRSFTPDVICFPHAGDWNSRHISTHHLAMDALQQMDESFGCTVVETEFWGAMDDPNLMVEADAELVADLVAATALHVGEVTRNPYHLLLPAWMQDNVRRGGELVSGQGAAAPDFNFAVLYRLRRWKKGAFTRVLNEGEVLAVGSAGIKEIF